MSYSAMIPGIHYMIITPKYSETRTPGPCLGVNLKASTGRSNPSPISSHSESCSFLDLPAFATLISRSILRFLDG